MPRESRRRAALVFIHALYTGRRGCRGGPAWPPCSRKAPHPRAATQGRPYENGGGNPDTVARAYLPFAAAASFFTVSRLMATLTSSPSIAPPASSALFQTIP